MTDAERQRLAAILGMLGSDHAGERDAAGLQAEAFRRKHGLTWAEMINGKTVYVSSNSPQHTTPEPAAQKPPPPPPPSYNLYPFEFAPWTPIPLTPWKPKKKGWLW